MTVMVMAIVWLVRLSDGSLYSFHKIELCRYIDVLIHKNRDKTLVIKA
jgi:hypothetical protein